MSKSLFAGLPSMLLPLATAIGVWGGFPKPPEIFQRLARSELFQYFLVFIYIWQSFGSKQDIQVSLMATVVVFLVAKFLDLRGLIMSLNGPSASQQPIVVVQQAPQQ